MRIFFLSVVFITSLFAKVQWHTNYDKALKLAQDNHKNIYMLIVSDYCRWCKRFELSTLKDKKLLKRLDEKYILLHLSRDRDSIPTRFKTAPIPRHYFLSETGEIIFPVVGYRDVETFNSFLDTVQKRIIRRKK